MPFRHPESRNCPLSQATSCVNVGQSRTQEAGTRPWLIQCFFEPLSVLDSPSPILPLSRLCTVASRGRSCRLVRHTLVAITSFLVQVVLGYSLDILLWSLLVLQRGLPRPAVYDRGYCPHLLPGLVLSGGSFATSTYHLDIVMFRLMAYRLGFLSPANG
jgi:hypothetical protein